MTPTDLIAFEQDIAAAFNASQIRAPVHLSGGNEQQLIDYFQQNYDAARGDWIFSNWRSHYHVLLVGVPPSRLRADILAGRSITLTYPDHRIFSSAIVGGALPIALGTALSIKRGFRDEIAASILTEINLGDLKYDENGLGRIETAVEDVFDAPVPRVHCFIGDMTARTGIFHECLSYARGHALPIHFIIEDNGKSVMTPTAEVWGDASVHFPSPIEIVSDDGPFTTAEARAIMLGGNATNYSLLDEDPPDEYVTRYSYSLPWPHAGAGVRVQF